MNINLLSSNEYQIGSHSSGLLRQERGVRERHLRETGEAVGDRYLREFCFAVRCLLLTRPRVPLPVVDHWY